MKKIITYIVITFVLSSYSYYKMILNGSLDGLDNLVFLLMWSPAVSAIITKLIYDKTIKGLGWKLGKIKYLLQGYLIPLIACLIVYTAVWLIGLGDIDITNLKSYQEGQDGLLFYIIILIILATLGLLGSIITALGEEIGWRGFLTPELSIRFSYIKVSLISGLIWSVYHYPVLLFGGYNNGTSILLSFIFFTINVFAISFIATYLRLKSKSLWPAVILHASHNLFVQGIFDHITVDKGYTKIFTTEFGFGLSIIYVLIALYYYKKRSNLELVN